MKACPACGSDQIYPSRSRTMFERVKLVLTQQQPFRCHACHFRGWAPIPKPHQGPDAKPDDLRIGKRPPPVTGADLDRLDKP